MKKIFFVLICTLMFNFQSCYAASVNNLCFDKGQTYLLLLDDRILDVFTSDKTTLELSVLDSIFDGKNQIIITPKQVQPTNLFIKGANTSYNFSISVNDEAKNCRNIVENAPTERNFDVVTLDMPPANGDIDDSDIDLPPAANE